MKYLLLILLLFGKRELIPLPVIVLCGQSNMEGGDTNTINTPANMTGIFNDCLIAYKPSHNIAQNDIVIQPLQYGVNNNFRTPLIKFGPEPGIAYYTNQKIGIIKYGYAGSQLNDKKDGVKDKAGHWQIDAIPADGPIHYYNLIHNFIIPSFAAYEAMGYKPYIAAFCWAQGEEDSKTKLAANNYQTNLTNLLNQFKTDVRPYDALVDSMIVIITLTRSDFPGQWVNKVNTAKINVAAVYPKTFLINPDSFSVVADGIHYTRQDQANKHGKQIAEITGL